MTKAEFVSQVAEKAGISRAAAARAVDAVFGRRTEMPGLLREGESVVLHKEPASSEPASVGDIRDLAVSVWENPADAEEFLTTSHGLLDGETPLSVASTPEGAARVREILLALEYGLPV